RMDEQGVDSFVAAVDHRLPPDLVWDEHDLGAERLDAVELRARSVLGRDDGRMDAELARRPADTLRHVAGARGDDVLRRLCAHRIEGTAQLERADRLQRLELEED